MSNDNKQYSRRSQAWFAPKDTLGFTHRSWLKNQGYPEDMFDGRPVIGISEIDGGGRYFTVNQSVSEERRSFDRRLTVRLSGRRYRHSTSRECLE